MEVTQFGLVMAFLLTAVLVFRPSAIMSLLIYVSVFPAASVLNISSSALIGVQAYYFMAIFLTLAALVGLIFRMGEVNISYPLRRATFAFMLFVFYAFAISFVTPVYFSYLEVYAPREGIDTNFLMPLKWSISNLAQSGYLILNLGVLLYAVKKISSEAAVSRAISALRAAAITVVGFSVYQEAAYIFGWVMPVDLLYSNPVYAISYQQNMGGVLRVNSTFQEPSVAGAFLASYLSFLFVLYVQGGHRWILWFEIILVQLALLLTTSTTAYVAAFAMATLVFSKFFLPSMLRGGVDPQAVRSAVVVAPMVLIVLGAALFVPGILEIILQITIEKTQTGSFNNRTGADMHGFKLMWESWGLGVGLGSNRPSSFASYLAGNVGVVGAVAFVAFIFMLIRIQKNKYELLEDCINCDKYLLPSIYGMIGMLVSMTIAVPDINLPVLWVWILLVFVLANIKYRKAPASLDAER